MNVQTGLSAEQMATLVNDTNTRLTEARMRDEEPIVAKYACVTGEDGRSVLLEL